MPRSGWRLGRYLASCGRLFGDNKTLTHYKRNEVREMVRAYFQAQLDQYLHWLDIRGLSKNALEDVRCEMLDHESYLDMEMDSDMHLPVKRFVRKSCCLTTGCSRSIMLLPQPNVPGGSRPAKADCVGP